MHNYEVIVVGAGPSGCAAAVQLSNLNPHLAERILLLDKAVFPRAKLCAGGLSPAADLALSQLGLAYDLPSIPVHKGNLILPNGRLTFEQPNLCPGVNPEQVYYFLLRSARERGITVQDGEAVKHVQSTSDEVIVQTSRNEYRAKVLIAADGANSTVRGQLGFSRGGRLMAAMELHAPLDAISAPSPVDHNVAVVDLSLMNRGVPGYGWGVPAVVAGSQARSVGIAVAPFTRGENIPLRDAFASWLATLDLDLSAFEAKAYPSLRYEPQADCSRHRVLFVGDAAGVDPLFGEGITSGLALGILAGQTAFDALRDHDFSFSNYERRIRRSPIGSMMCRRYMVARRLYSYPKLAQFFLRQGALFRGIALLTDPKTRTKLRWEPLYS